MPDGAMQFFNGYGWIHWDGHTKTWHTVTGYELGNAGKAPQTRHQVVVAQLVQPGLRLHGIDEDLLDLPDIGEDLLDFEEQTPGAGTAPADGAPADAIPADVAPADAVPADAVNQAAAAQAAPPR